MIIKPAKMICCVVALVLAAEVIIFVSAPGFHREQPTQTPRYDGSAFDMLSENCATLEKLVQLFMDHPEAFMLPGEEYSRSKDLPLWMFHDSNTDSWPCFSNSEYEFIVKCKADLSLEHITLYEARADTYAVLELLCLSSSAPYSIYWIDIPEDDFGEDKFEHTAYMLLRPHPDNYYIVKALGNNWYMLSNDKQ